MSMLEKFQEAADLFEKLDSNDLRSALKSLEDVKYVLLAMDRKYPAVTKEVMKSMKDVYTLEKSLGSLQGTFIHTKSLKSYRD
jgi:hypothetical protein